MNDERQRFAEKFECSTNFSSSSSLPTLSPRLFARSFATAAVAAAKAETYDKM